MIDEIFTFGFSGMYLLFLIIFGISMLIAVITKIPFVPTPKRIIHKLIEIADLKGTEKIYDLGCGDGRLLFITESKTSIAGTGYEISPMPLIISKIKKFFLKSKVEIKAKNFLKQDLSDADTIFVYLIPDIMPKLAKKLKNECKKGTKIISHTFKIKDLQTKKIYKKDKSKKLPVIYVYEI